MTFTFFAVLIIIVCFLLVVIIMVQNPKGGGLATTFGGSQQMIGSVQKTNEFLDRSTWTLAGAIVVLSILSSMTLQNSKQTGIQDDLHNSCNLKRNNGWLRTAYIPPWLYTASF